MIKYIVSPGFIGQNYVTCQALIRLYKVNPKECVLLIKPDALTGLRGEFILLEPKPNNDYSLDNCTIIKR